MDSTRHTSIVRFGTFEVAFPAGELRKSGVRIKVQQQPMKLLEILLERHGEVVAREELRQRVWPEESFGDFDQAVNIAIAKLRSALGDSAENPRYIETLPKRGYRFIAQVSVENRGKAPIGESLESQKVESEDQPKIRATQHRVLWGVLGIALCIGVAIFAFWMLRSANRGSNRIRSLAVLPLENLSKDDSQDYFADGMTDELITDLAQIGALRVVSRTSAMQYKNTHKPLAEIARELNVDAVVEGTVLRSGQQVRITAQLINAPIDQHLWAQSYEGDLRDTLALQKKVANAIAQQIRIELTPREEAALRDTKTVDPEVYEDYLKGRYFWNKRSTDGLKKAIDYFNNAIEKDPNYADAYTGLADSYALAGDWQYGLLTSKQALPKAKDAAMKALEIDNSLGEAHASLAFSYDVFDWNWTAADQEFRRAIELNPGYATAHHWYAWHLCEMGKMNEAIAEMKKAQTLDPLSLIINADLAEQLLIAHQYDESIQQSKKTIEMAPDFAVAHYALGEALMQKRSYPAAIAELETAVKLSGGSPICKSNLANAYLASGRRNDALKIKDELIQQSNSDSNAAEVALVYAGLHQNDQAMVWLEKAYSERFNPSILLRPGFDSLRSDTSFQNLLKRIGLPQPS